MTRSPHSTRESKQRRRGRSVQTRSRRIWPWALLGVLIVGIIALITSTLLRTQNSQIANLQTFADVETGHKEGTLTYAQTPPAGGVHNQVWQNCGIYNQPILSENAVHSQEHGAVWITYRPDLPAEEIEELRKAVRRKNYTLLSPYEGLPAPVVASAWGVQVQLDGVNDPRLERFITTYRQGLQAPEPGAACSNGIGFPDDI